MYTPVYVLNVHLNPSPLSRRGNPKENTAIDGTARIETIPHCKPLAGLNLSSYALNILIHDIITKCSLTSN